MQSIALVIHVLLAIGVIGLVLIQHGKGADAGAAFGSGASATVFGARGSASFLTRATTVLAGLFFLTSIALFYLAAHRDRTVRSVTDGPSVIEQSAPAAVAPAADTDLPGGVDTEAAPATTPAADPAGAGDATSSTPEGGAGADSPAVPSDAAPAAGDDLPPAPNQ